MVGSRVGARRRCSLRLCASIAKTPYPPATPSSASRYSSGPVRLFAAQPATLLITREVSSDTPRVSCFWPKRPAQVPPNRDFGSKVSESKDLAGQERSSSLKSRSRYPGEGHSPPHPRAAHHCTVTVYSGKAVDSIQPRGRGSIQCAALASVRGRYGCLLASPGVAATAALSAAINCSGSPLRT